MMESDTYAAEVRIGEDRAPGYVMVSPVPLIDYELLQHLRMKVNPLTHRLEKVSAEDEDSPRSY